MSKIRNDKKIYDSLNAKTKPEFLYVPYIKQRKIFLQKKRFIKERSGGLKKKIKRRLFNGSRYGD